MEFFDRALDDFELMKDEICRIAIIGLRQREARVYWAGAFLRMFEINRYSTSQ